MPMAGLGQGWAARSPNHSGETRQPDGGPCDAAQGASNPAKSATAQALAQKIESGEVHRKLIFSDKDFCIGGCPNRL